MSYGRFDIQIQRINRRRKAWKEEVNHIDRYYYEQKLRDYSEEKNLLNGTVTMNMPFSCISVKKTFPR